MLSVQMAIVHTRCSRVHNCIAAVNKWLTGDESVNLDGVAKAAFHAAREANNSWATRPEAKQH
jgi:hypothetical protein